MISSSLSWSRRNFNLFSFYVSHSSFIALSFSRISSLVYGSSIPPRFSLLIEFLSLFLLFRAPFSSIFTLMSFFLYLDISFGETTSGFLFDAFPRDRTILIASRRSIDLQVHDIQNGICSRLSARTADEVSINHCTSMIHTNYNLNRTIPLLFYRLVRSICQYIYVYVSQCRISQ